jgi:hypothetical protein
VSTCASGSGGTVGVSGSAAAAHRDSPVEGLGRAVEGRGRKRVLSVMGLDSSSSSLTFPRNN